jgi:hypothetical protein
MPSVPLKSVAVFECQTGCRLVNFTSSSRLKSERDRVCVWDGHVSQAWCSELLSIPEFPPASAIGTTTVFFECYRLAAVRGFSVGR